LGEIKPKKEACERKGKNKRKYREGVQLSLESHTTRQDKAKSEDRTEAGPKVVAGNKCSGKGKMDAPEGVNGQFK